jgi:urea carboxylase
VLEVIEPGALSTIQDGGRLGYLDQGVPRSGAADGWSLGVANLLLGNRAHAAVLEMTLLGPAFAVRSTGTVAIAGADFGAEIPEEGRTLAPGGSYLVRAGTTLRFGAARSGVRGYLALPGGIDVAVVLDSASTCLAGGFGGIDGRPLRGGDVLVPSRTTAGPGAGRRWPVAGFDPLDDAAIRVVSVPDADGVHAAVMERLLGAAWTISARSDRTGVRLEGSPLPTDRRAGALVSRGVVPGALQVPPDGWPIVLLADGPTVGGYPVPAVVASTDLARLAQRPTGAEVRFAAISVQEAQMAWRRHAAELATVGDRLAARDTWESGV